MKSRIIILLFLAVLVIVFFVFNLGQYFSFDILRDRQAEISDYKLSHPINSAIIFFIIYVTTTGLSLPVAGILTLAGGVIFGLVWGTVLVSFASSIGATIAFLAARFLFRDYVQTRFSKNLETINKGIKEDGVLYLFMLRMTGFPFFVINLAMALTTIRTITFYIVSQISMLPVTIIFVFAGTQLAIIKSFDDILSPKTIGSLALLGLFPLLVKKLALYYQFKRKQADLTKNG